MNPTLLPFGAPSQYDGRILAAGTAVDLLTPSAETVFLKVLRIKGIVNRIDSGSLKIHFEGDVANPIFEVPGTVGTFVWEWYYPGKSGGKGKKLQYTAAGTTVDVTLSVEAFELNQT